MITNVRIEIEKNLFEKYKKIAKKNGLELQYLNSKLFKKIIINYIDGATDVIDKILGGE